MAGQPGFFDGEERLKALSAAGDPLERLAQVVDFEVFRTDLETVLARSDRSKGGRPPYDPVLMFKVLVLQRLYTLSDDQSEYQLKDRLSFMRFVGLALHDPVPDAKTIWLFREQLARTGAVERLFARFDALLRARGWLAMAGQIVDATAIEARRPRLSQAGEGHGQRRRHPIRVEAGAARPDRPRRALDDQARQEARSAAECRLPAPAGDRGAAIRLQKPCQHRPRARFAAALCRDPCGGL
jgi:transposase